MKCIWDPLGFLRTLAKAMVSWYPASVVLYVKYHLASSFLVPLVCVCVCECVCFETGMWIGEVKLSGSVNLEG